jgi:hypothetical protein
MKFKYIVIKRNEVEDMYIFPEDVNHDEFLDNIRGIRFNLDKYEWTRDYLEEKNTLVSAGFIVNGKCEGRSHSLDVSSRNEVDTALFITHMGLSTTDNSLESSSDNKPLNLFPKLTADTPAIFNQSIVDSPTLQLCKGHGGRECSTCKRFVQNFTYPNLNHDTHVCIKGAPTDQCPACWTDCRFLIEK